MKKHLLLLVTLLLFITTGYSQTGLWSRADEKSIPQSALLNRASVPSRYHIFQLDLTSLKAILATAPLRGNKLSSHVVIQFPDGNGQLKNFKVYEAPVMQAGLSAKYPTIKSYVGHGVEKPSETIRFSITGYGLHTMLSTDEGTSYTDPYTKDGLTYVAYKRSALTPRTFRCDVKETAAKNNQEPGFTTLSEPATDGLLRTYRLAMACTIEYAAFHIEEAGLTGGTLEEQTAAVLSAMVVTVTRVNSVYEKDFGISLQLIDNNDELIFIESDDFDNENTNDALLNQSQPVIDGIVGFDSYDIGHTVSTGGGGIAQLYSPCSNNKGRGITGLFAPVGDAYDIDFVAHEIGHQFGGNHTFNVECGGNRNDSTAYEPGSGSTIMAYAGVCFPSVQNNSDAYFHKHSILEITNFMKNWGDCAVNTETGNEAPVADAGSDYTIPYGTPFILKGTATDADDDALTYCWEQMDLEISEQPPLTTSAEGPNFRSLPPVSSPERYLPVLEEVLNNNLFPTWEVISDVEREYNFVLTVRDNNPLGGQTAYDDMKVNVSGAAGPFLVTVPSTNVSWVAGSNQNVTWNVAGTNANGVNAAYVDILMSNDGGLTYPVVLASKVPNDGSEVITVPTATGVNKRIMIRGHNHIFYDLSDSDFTITAAPSTMAITVNGEQNQIGCKGGEVTYSLFYQALEGFSGDTTFAVTGNPSGTTVTFDPATINVSGNVNIVVEVPQTVVTGFYSMTVTATSGAVSKIASLYLEVIDTNFGTVALTSPANEAEELLNTVSFTWSETAGATAYKIEVATDAGFETIVVDEMVENTSFITTLSDATGYFWRVQPVNLTCTGASSGVFTFTTGETTCADFVSTDVPLIISDSAAATINSTLTVTSTEEISRLSVDIDIDHTWVGDLTAILVSPAGTEVTLFQNVCEDDADNVNAVFDDFGNEYECGSNPAISGFLLPTEQLSQLNGQSPEGVWTLKVIDNFSDDGGQLNSWSLTICNTEAPTSNINDNVLANLSVFPNPNKGDFTVKFVSATGNNIKIAVYDIRGRQLLNKAFENTGIIEQPISLNNAQAGVYLVNIQDGESVVTKKIIIQ